MQQIPWLDSQVIRALLVATAGLIGVILSFFGIDEKLFNEQATRLIDALSVLLSVAGVAWAAYARTRLPTPPISQAASNASDKREAQEQTE